MTTTKNTSRNGPAKNERRSQSFKARTKRHGCLAFSTKKSKRRRHREKSNRNSCRPMFQSGPNVPKIRPIVARANLWSPAALKKKTNLATSPNLETLLNTDNLSVAVRAQKVWGPGPITRVWAFRVSVSIGCGCKGGGSVGKLKFNVNFRKLHFHMIIHEQDRKSCRALTAALTRK